MSDSSARVTENKASTITHALAFPEEPSNTVKTNWTEQWKKAGGHQPTSLSDVRNTIAVNEIPACGNKRNSHTQLDFLSITPTHPSGWLKSASEDCG